MLPPTAHRHAVCALRASINQNRANRSARSVLRARSQTRARRQERPRVRHALRANTRRHRTRRRALTVVRARSRTEAPCLARARVLHARRASSRQPRMSIHALLVKPESMLMALHRRPAKPAASARSKPRPVKPSVMHAQPESTRHRQQQLHAAAAQRVATAARWPRHARSARTVSTAARAPACAMTAQKAITDSATAHAQRNAWRESTARRARRTAPTVVWVGTSLRPGCTSASHVRLANTMQARAQTMRINALRARAGSIRRLRGRASARAVLRVRSAAATTLQA